MCLSLPPPPTTLVTTHNLFYVCVFPQSTRTGGAGSVRRKKKAVHKTTSNDDKRLQSVMKKLQSNVIPAVEEANLFLEDGNVVHIERPKVQASIGANTYVISGKSETKRTLPRAVSTFRVL